MSIRALEQNAERLQASLKFYAELYSVKKASPAELENIKLKKEYIKKEILKLTLKNKKLLRELELRYEKRGGHHG